MAKKTAAAEAEASHGKLVQIITAPANLMTKGVEAGEGVEAVTPQHVLALGLTEDGSVVALTKDDVQNDVTI